MSNQGSNNKLDKMIDLILKHEGGKVNDPKDRGGKTNAGITQKGYDEFCNRNHLSKKDVYTLSQNEVRSFYQTEFSRFKADKINDPGVAFAFYDACTLHGFGGGTKIMQKALEIKADSKMGPQTLEAINNAANPAKLINKFMDQRLTKIQQIVTNDNSQKRFEKGWKNRVRDVRREATEIHNKDINNQPSQPSNNLGGINMDLTNIQVIKSISGIQGLMLNIDLGVIYFLKDKTSAIQNLSKRNSLIHLATSLKIMHDEHKLYSNIAFSLDPLVPSQPEGPKFEKVCYPDKLIGRKLLAGTPLGELMFECDYLMKKMSLGVQDDSKTLFNYPQELCNAGIIPIHKLDANKQGKSRWCRLWIEAKEVRIFEYEDETQAKSVYVDNVIIVVKAKQMVLVNGELQDSECQDSQDSWYKFAQWFTQNYDLISKYYGCFAELKEAYKAIALSQWLRKHSIPINLDLIDKIWKEQQIPSYSSTVNSLRYEWKEIKKIPVEKREYAIRCLQNSNMTINESNIVNAIQNLTNQKVDFNNIHDTQEYIYSCFGGVNMTFPFNVEIVKNSTQQGIISKSSKISDLEMIPFFLIAKKKCQTCSITLDLEELMHSCENGLFYCSEHHPHCCSFCLEFFKSGETFVSFTGEETAKYHQHCAEIVQEVDLKNQKNKLREQKATVTNQLIFEKYQIDLIKMDMSLMLLQEEHQWDCELCGRNQRNMMVHCEKCGLINENNFQNYLKDSNQITEPVISKPAMLNARFHAEQDWNCQFCSMINKGEMKCCEVCMNPKNQLQEIVWSCPMCYRNVQDKMMCECGFVNEELF